MCFDLPEWGNPVLQCKVVFHTYTVRCSPSEAGTLLIKILGVQNQKDSAAAPSQSAIGAIRCASLATQRF